MLGINEVQKIVGCNSHCSDWVILRRMNGWMDAPGFDSWQGQEVFLLVKMYRLTLRW